MLYCEGQKVPPTVGVREDVDGYRVATHLKGCPTYAETSLFISDFIRLLLRPSHLQHVWVGFIKYTK